MEPVFPAGPDIAALRRRIAAIEGRLEAGARLDLDGTGASPRRAGRAAADPREAGRRGGRNEGAPAPEGPSPAAGPGAPSSGGTTPRGRSDDFALPLGLDELDGAFAAGGLPLGALHELVAAESREAGALAGFAAALAARLLARRDGTVLWVAERDTPREAGRLHAPGLHALGLDPGRVVEVAARDPADALWVMEEAIRNRGVAAVLVEIRGSPRTLDLTATRRLALRARDRPVLGLLLRIDAVPEPTAALTRWRIRTRPAATLGGFAAGVGRPAFRLDLVKNREGRLGGWDLEWNPHERRFDRLAPDPVALPAAPVDGPADPGRTGQVLALRRVS